MPKAKPSPAPSSASSKAAPDPKSAVKTKAAAKASARSSGDVGTDPVALLERDHREVDALFEKFEAASGDAPKRQIVNDICVALKVHARLEEELFYPAAATVLGQPDLIDEAMVEHMSAKDLIAQIETGAPGEAFYDARVKVLAEYIRHHVAEEEGEIFPKVRASKLDLEALGEQMAVRKHELMLGFTVSNPILGLA